MFVVLFFVLLVSSGPPLDVLYLEKDLFRQMQLNGISCNYYWPKALDEYEKHIDWTLESEPS